MSPIAAGMDGLLALLLVLALGLGMRLNARLKTLREGQAGFAAAVIELNQAAARAEAGLNALRTASEGAHDELLTRIETARGLVGRLERAGSDAQRILDAAPDRTPVSSRPLAGGGLSGGGLGGTLAAIAAIADARGPDYAPDRTSEPPAAPETPRSAKRPLGLPRRAARPAFDDELFETKPRERGELGPLRPPRGDR